MEVPHYLFARKREPSERRILGPGLMPGLVPRFKGVFIYDYYGSVTFSPM
jgi:hypothetical protein